MKIFFVTLGVLLLAVAGMAIGSIVARRHLKGTCGGLNTLRPQFGDEAVCGICGKDPRTEATDCAEAKGAQTAAAAPAPTPVPERSPRRAEDPLFG